MFKYYLEVIKPRIVFGNIILTIGSFLFASQKHINFILFGFTILGVSLVIASSCIFNNLLDIKIDAKMHRTQHRVLVKKLLRPISVVIFGLIIGILGFFILFTFVNVLSMVLSIIGFIIYVFIYTLLKKYSIYSTLIGSFSGAIPALIGYTAVNNIIDVFCILLFFIFIFWQMSHFYAISIIHIEDYRHANLMLFPIVKGIFKTKQYIFYYIICFSLSTAMLTFLGYLGYIFLILISILNLYWLYISYLNIKEKNHFKFSSKIFYFSIIIVVFFNILIAIDFKF